jgi:hypothetical protein
MKLRGKSHGALLLLVLSFLSIHLPFQSLNRLPPVSPLSHSSTAPATAGNADGVILCKSYLHYSLNGSWVQPPRPWTLKTDDDLHPLLHGGVSVVRSDLRCGRHHPAGGAFIL